MTENVDFLHNRISVEVKKTQQKPTMTWNWSSDLSAGVSEEIS